MFASQFWIDLKVNYSNNSAVYCFPVALDSNPLLSIGRYAPFYRPKKRYQKYSNIAGGFLKLQVEGLYLSLIVSNEHIIS